MSSSLVHIPLQGDFDELAYHYVHVAVGTPPKIFSVVVDTGSSLLAFPCSDCQNCASHHRRYSVENSSTGLRLKCNSLREGELSPDPLSPPYCSSCGAFGDCVYSRSYSEGSTIGGRFVREVVSLAEGSDILTMQFGCYTRESGLFTTQIVDGILGLSGGPLALPMAFATVTGSKRLKIGESSFINAIPSHFSLCQTRKGGVLNLGGWDTRLHISSSHHFSTPLYLSPSGLYTALLESVQVGSAGGRALEFDGKNMLNGPKSSPLKSPYAWMGVEGESGGGGGSGDVTYIDSGSSYTYLPRELLMNLISTIERECWKPQLQDSLSTPHHGCKAILQPKGSLPPGQVLCVRLLGEADVHTLPGISLKFVGGGVWDIDPSHLYLFTPWTGDFACLQLFPSDEAGGRTVLGSNAMMGYDVGFFFETPPTSTLPRADHTPATTPGHTLKWARSVNCTPTATTSSSQVLVESDGWGSKKSAFMAQMKSLIFISKSSAPPLPSSSSSFILTVIGSYFYVAFFTLLAVSFYHLVCRRRLRQSLRLGGSSKLHLKGVGKLTFV